MDCLFTGTKKVAVVERWWFGGSTVHQQTIIQAIKTLTSVTYCLFTPNI